VAIGTDCIGSCEINYHTITVTTAPFWRLEPPTSTKDQNGHLFFFGAGERGIMENKLISSEMYELFMNCILEYYGSNGYDFIEKHWTTDKRRPDAT
jgi:hypothetical protein